MKRLYTAKEFRDSFSKEQLAKIYCKLNGWKTPDCFNLAQDLSGDEVKENMEELRKCLTKGEWLPIWQQYGSDVLV